MESGIAKQMLKEMKRDSEEVRGMLDRMITKYKGMKDEWDKMYEIILSSQFNNKTKK